MEEITPITPENQDVLLYIRTLKKEINELDNNIIVIFKDEYNNRVGKMEYTKYRSKLQGVKNILTSYDFSEVQDELNNYQTTKSPIVTIDEYIQKLI